MPDLRGQFSELGSESSLCCTVLHLPWDGLAPSVTPTAEQDSLGYEGCRETTRMEHILNGIAVFFRVFWTFRHGFWGGAVAMHCVSQTGVGKNKPWFQRLPKFGQSYSVL